MNQQAVADPDGAPPFFDPFQCYRVAVSSAKARNHMAMAAKRNGDEATHARHIDYRNWLMSRARQWRDMIDFTGEYE